MSLSRLERVVPPLVTALNKFNSMTPYDFNAKCFVHNYSQLLFLFLFFFFFNDCKQGGQVPFTAYVWRILEDTGKAYIFFRHIIEMGFV